MNIEAISKRLVELLSNRELLQAQQELFDPGAVSIEPAFHSKAKTEGLTSILRKEKEFLNAIKIWHQFEVSEPIISKDHFCIRMHSKLTLLNNQQVEVDEVIVYEVRNQKIVKEQFFYTIPN